MQGMFWSNESCLWKYFGRFLWCLRKSFKKEKIEQRVDYDHVRKVIAHDSRIGDSWLDVKHGKYRGFGGFCFPKDTAAFIAFGKKIERN